MSAWLDACRFNPTAGGTTDWTYSSAVTGYQSPTAAGAVNGRVYAYRAESADLSQWEIGTGAYNSATGVFARTTILFSSNANAKVTFSAAPQVAIVALKEDLISIEEANSFTTAQKAQAQTNIYVPPTRTVLTSGSGTYAVPANVKWIDVEVQGGGAGGAGSGTGLGVGTAGGNSTFGSSLLTANGGGVAVTSGISTGGTATGGDINISGGDGSGGNTLANTPGPTGGASYFGGQGAGAGQNGTGSAAKANSGSGGGGAGSASVAAAGPGGGAAGGYCRKLISSPLATYSYAVGAGGNAGTAGTSGTAGGAGAAGTIIITEYYGS